MYSTCTFCHAPLGANEMIERFPVGRRLAFDTEKGRLWVVCGACRQWNLSPLDERWEAIEAAERHYRDTRLRVATDQVGLAKLRDGTELIRIGRPLRPEFAAWRYGDRFVTRWRRYAVGTAVFGVGAYSLGPMLGLGFSMFPYYLVSWTRTALSRRRVAARIDDDQGPIAITNEHLKEARLETSPAQPEGWQLSIPHLRRATRVGGLVGSVDEGVARLVISGPEAVQALRQVMPRVNESGGRKRVVADAVQLIEEIGDVRQTFLRAATSVGRDAAGDPSRLLTTLDAPLRLALEMAAHEDIERRALEGELAALEEAWKQAEEIAAIADSLTLPEWIIDRLNRPIGG